MDNELKENDPYNNMETAEDGIEPDFLKGSNDTQGKKPNLRKRMKQNVVKAAELAAMANGVPAGAASGAGAGAASGEAASGALTKSAGGVEGLKKGETSPDSFFYRKR